MAEVTEQFGKPEEIAATFFEQYSKDGIKRKVNIRRVVVTAVVVALLIFAFSVIISLIEGSNAKVDRIIEGSAVEVNQIQNTDALN